MVLSPGEWFPFLGKRLLIPFLIAGMIFTAAGCWKKPPPPSPPPAQQVAPATTAVSESPSPPDSDPKAIAAAPETASPPAPATVSEEKPAEPTATTDTSNDMAKERSNSPPSFDHRMLVITPQGPLVIGLKLMLGETPLDQAFEAMARDLQKEVDTNADGTATWEELLKNTTIRNGSYGNVAITTPENEKEVLRRYDLNRNGNVDLVELQRFVTRSAGGGRSFSVRGEYDLVRASPRLADTWQLLQGMETGSNLSPTAISAASQHLRAKDSDSDDRVTREDLSPARGLTAAGMPRRNPGRRRLQGSMVYALNEETPWNSVFIQLSEFYALGGNLHPNTFVASPTLYSYLDENQDGKLVSAEIKRLLTAPVDFSMTVHFPTAGETASLESTATSPQGVELTQPSPGRLTWRSAHAKLQFVVADQLQLTAAEDQQAQALLAQLDQNRDGYLEPSEVTPPSDTQIPFAAVDANQDGKIYPQELVAFFQKRRLPLQVQVHTRVELHPDSLFAWLDKQEDDLLDGAEIAAASARLQSLAADPQVGLSSDEIPLVVRITLARGDLTNPDLLFTPPALRPATPSGNAPAWFTAMDTSGDGLVSRLEFLGDRTLFDQLDKDQDNFLTATEVVMAVSPPTNVPSPH